MPKNTKHEDSLMRIAEQSGINYNTLYRRIHKQGMTLEEATSAPLMSKSQIMRQRWHEPNSKLRQIHQKIYHAVSPSGEHFTITQLNQWCKQMGWNRMSLQHRIKNGDKYKGWTVHKALTPNQKPTQAT